MYSFESVVRYSEVDKDKHLSDTALVNYFQDCSSFDSERLGVGFDALREAGKGWVLSYWQIEIKDMPAYLDNVKICTWPYDFDNFYGYRNFLLEDEKGNIAASANSIWVFIDAETFRPTKLEERFKDAYTLEPRFEGMEYEGRKIVVPCVENMEMQEPFPVKKHCIDTNCHVNNGQYIQMAMEYLPEEFDVKRIRVSYKRSAVLGDVIHPYVQIKYENKLYTMNQIADDSGVRFSVDLRNSENQTFAIVEFTGRV